MMKIPYVFALGLLLVSALLLSWGCQDKQPLAPSRVISLHVKVPMTKAIRSSLLGSGSNELIYRVDGSSSYSPIREVLGPFSTPADDGSVEFEVDIPNEDGLVLSVQLNDTATGDPLAVGAVGLYPSFLPLTDIDVDLGSVTRNCYYTVVPNFSDFQYDFLNDAVTFSGLPVYDIRGQATGAPVEHTLYSPPATQNIAYLGNGQLVDHDFVPDDTEFYYDSVTAKGAVAVPGDIFCVKLTTMYGYAWMQIIDPGQFNNNGPKFRFRTSYLPYFAHNQTDADYYATCSNTW